VTDSKGRARAEWNADLYNSKHDFVWKYGYDAVLSLW
jgi:hypothetical protein